MGKKDIPANVALHEERRTIYREIQERAEEAGAVEGDPRWYGINIALRVVSDRMKHGVELELEQKGEG